MTQFSPLPSLVLRANSHCNLLSGLRDALGQSHTFGGTRQCRVDPSWKKGRRRRFERRAWDVVALSLLPLPPTLLMLALAFRDHEPPCPSAQVANALAAACILATIYLFARLIQIARATVRRRLLITASDLARLGIFVAIGSGTYVSIAKNLLWRGCL